MKGRLLVLALVVGLALLAVAGCSQEAASTQRPASPPPRTGEVLGPYSKPLSQGEQRADGRYFKSLAEAVSNVGTAVPVPDQKALGQPDSVCLIAGPNMIPEILVIYRSGVHLVLAVGVPGSLDATRMATRKPSGTFTDGRTSPKEVTDVNGAPAVVTSPGVQIISARERHVVVGGVMWRARGVDYLLQDPTNKTSIGELLRIARTTP